MVVVYEAKPLRPRRSKTVNHSQQSARRGSFRVIFGEGDERWSLGDPGHPIVDNAQHRVRYGVASGNDGALVLADIVSDMHYLVHVCPDTKQACAKLAALRAAVRRLGPVTDETGLR
jgi:hypothetical protein